MAGIPSRRSHLSMPADLIRLAAIIPVIWLAGCGLLAALTLSPASRDRVGGLWPLMLSEAGILAAGTLPWLLPQPVLGLLLAGAACRIGYESGTVNGSPSRPMSGNIAAGVLTGLVAAVWFPGDSTWPIGLVLLGASIIGLAPMISRYPNLAWLWRFLLFPALPLVLFALAARDPDVAFAFLLSFLVVEIFDSFSLLGGHLFGKHPLAPKLSPRKTWEGLAFGLLAVICSTAALALIFSERSAMVVAIATVATPGALAGDLIASFAKRKAGVKDYPAILPIQGGLLDIMDAWLVAGPLAALAAILLR